MQYFVYILTNKHKTVLYVGVTNDLARRVYQHKIKLNKGFTNKYNCDRLMYFEEFTNRPDAMHREKQLKKYHRTWKVELIEGMNPGWNDLSEGWYNLAWMRLVPGIGLTVVRRTLVAHLRSSA